MTVLGSTGSVGANTLDLLERNRDRYVVEALTANSNVALLAEQARRLKPRLAVVADERHYAALKAALAGTGIEAAAGAAAVVEAATRPADWVMAAIVGRRRPQAHLGGRAPRRGRGAGQQGMPGLGRPADDAGGQRRRGRAAARRFRA